MDKNLKITKLWHYLQIQDELLVIQVHNSIAGADEYLVVEMIDGEPRIKVVNGLQDVPTDNIRVIKQRDKDGKYEIPDVDEIVREKDMDY